MGLKDKLKALQKRFEGGLDSFELESGERFYFDPGHAFDVTFSFFAESLRAHYLQKPRPAVPEILVAGSKAKDRRRALDKVLQGSTFLPVDADELVLHGRFRPRTFATSSPPVF